MDKKEKTKNLNFIIAIVIIIVGGLGFLLLNNKNCDCKTIKECNCPVVKKCPEVKECNCSEIAENKNESKKKDTDIGSLFLYKNEKLGFSMSVPKKANFNVITPKNEVLMSNMKLCNFDINSGDNDILLKVLEDNDSGVVYVVPEYFILVDENTNDCLNKADVLNGNEEIKKREECQKKAKKNARCVEYSLDIVKNSDQFFKDYNGDPGLGLKFLVKDAKDKDEIDKIVNEFFSFYKIDSISENFSCSDNPCDMNKKEESLYCDKNGYLCRVSFVPAKDGEIMTGETYSLYSPIYNKVMIVEVGNSSHFLLKENATDYDSLILHSFRFIN